MRGKRLIEMVLALVLLLLAPPAHSQGDHGGVYWHIDPSVKSCSMVIDPSLTQAQWETFVRQSGAILTFKSLAPAEPLGKMNVAIELGYSMTPVDQHDPAWINTFTHPDADCPLGDQIEFPTLRARLGISSTMDVGGYWTTAPGANYGLLGGEFKYAFLKESSRIPATALSTSFSTLTGVPDFDFSIYSVGFVASKRVAAFTPYLGVKESMAIGTETTDKVDLSRETILLTQGFIGANYSIWRLSLAAEYNISDLNTFTCVIGFHPRANLP